STSLLPVTKKDLQSSIFMEAFAPDKICGSGRSAVTTQERVMEAQSSTCFSKVVGPNLWYGDRTRLTPKQEEAALGLSRACGSGIPAYICTMKKSNVVKRQMEEEEGELVHYWKQQHITMYGHIIVIFRLTARVVQIGTELVVFTIIGAGSTFQLNSMSGPG
ncbi:hypothetical protein ACJX0J_027719, partial [Zea mays]